MLKLLPPTLKLPLTKTGCLILLFLCSIQSIRAQSPGGYSTNINLWLKANLGTSSTTNGTAISSWLDQATTNNGTQGTGSFQPIFNNNSGDNMNYNPVITFDGVDNHLDLPSGSAPVINENYTVFIVAQTHSLGATRCMYSLNHNFPHRSSRWRIEGSTSLSDQWGANIVLAPTVSIAQNYMLTTKYDNTVGRELFFDGFSTSTNTNTNHNALNSFGAYVGAMNVSGGPIQFWDGDIAEIIHFKEDMPLAERNKVHSYLAIKYGITIPNTGGGIQGDYTATNGSIVWDASLTNAYHNDVIGIGRDDSQSLVQKQSHTNDDSTRIYIDALQLINTANTGTFTNDASYVTIGHNQGKLCNTSFPAAEIPVGLSSCNIYSRLEREWKVTKTNIPQVFNVDIKLSGCGIPGSVTPSDLRLLVDDDGDFSNGGTTCYYNGDGTGIVLSYVGPTITISNISGTHITNNSTKYITIASIDVVTPLPVALTDFNATCEDNGILLNWNTFTETSNDYFAIERSRDGVNFEIIANIAGNGTSTLAHSYSYLDAQPMNGTSYYKLSQIDYNGATQFYPLRSVSCGEDKNAQISPNPFEDHLTINAQYNGSLKLLDLTGKIVLDWSFVAGTTVIPTHHLASGAYIARIFTINGKIQEIKLLNFR